MKQVYFLMKNEVFIGLGIAGNLLNMTQKSGNLEHILRREIGDTVCINQSIIDTVCTFDHLFLRVIICTVDKDQLPLKVQFLIPL